MGKYICHCGKNCGGEKLFLSNAFLSAAPSLAQASELLDALRKPRMPQMAAPQHLSLEAGLPYASLANDWKEVLPQARWVITSDAFLASKMRGRVSS